MKGKRVRVLIEGRVQGVSFRVNTFLQAKSRGVTGWVRNRSDGSVEAVLEGEPEAVEALIQWCQQGPRGAWVGQLTVNPEPFQGEFKEFSIRW